MEIEKNKIQQRRKKENKKVYDKIKATRSVYCECCEKEIYPYYLKNHIKTNKHIKNWLIETLKNT